MNIFSPHIYRNFLPVDLAWLLSILAHFFQECPQVEPRPMCISDAHSRRKSQSGWRIILQVIPILTILQFHLHMSVLSPLLSMEQFQTPREAFRLRRSVFQLVHGLQCRIQLDPLTDHTRRVPSLRRNNLTYSIRRRKPSNLMDVRQRVRKLVLRGPKSRSLRR